MTWFTKMTKGMMKRKRENSACMFRLKWTDLSPQVHQRLKGCILYTDIGCSLSSCHPLIHNHYTMTCFTYFYC